MKSLEEYISYFTRLRRAPNLGGAPHKPILLLSVIDAIEKGYIVNERIYITAELITLFKSNWKIWVRTQHIMRFGLPFYHLKNEPFWRLEVREEIPLTTNKSIQSFKSLVDAVRYAEIDKDLFFYLSQRESREILRKALTDKYFSQIQPIRTSDTSYLDIIAEQILRDSAIQYKKTIQSIKEKEDTNNFEEDVFIRNSVFQRRIPQIYDYTCSITGLRVESNYGHSLIDACHIIPFRLEHDDTIGNGIALCPNMHRAFDGGLITINDEYRVIVSDKFVENSCSSYSLRQYNNKELILPQNTSFHPRKEVLRWHKEHVFEKISRIAE